jgi:hypothetical protein
MIVKIALLTLTLAYFIIMTKLAIEMSAKIIKKGAEIEQQ